MYDYDTGKTSCLGTYRVFNGLFTFLDYLWWNKWFMGAIYFMLENEMILHSSVLLELPENFTNGRR